MSVNQLQMRQKGNKQPQNKQQLNKSATIMYYNVLSQKETACSLRGPACGSVSAAPSKIGASLQLYFLSLSFQEGDRNLTQRNHPSREKRRDSERGEKSVFSAMEQGLCSVIISISLKQCFVRTWQRPVLHPLPSLTPASDRL